MLISINQNEQEATAELTAAYGVKRKLTNHRKVYLSGEEEQSLNDI